MAFTVRKSEGGSTFTPIDAGTYIARCYLLVDMGTRDNTFEGRTRKRHTIRLGWEIPDEKRDFGKGKLEPCVVGKTYTFSLGKGDKPSALRADLESWRGKPFSEDEAEGFDVSKLLGHPCMLTVAHKPKQNGQGVNAIVTSVGKLMKGVVCPMASLPSVIYQIEQGDCATFRALPQWMQDDIKASDEWKALSVGGPPVHPDGEVADNAPEEIEPPF